MPVSRPFARAMRAVWFFLIGMYLISAILIYWWSQSEEGSIWYTLGISFSLLIALGMTARFFFNYKVIDAQKGKIKVNKPFLMSSKTLVMSDLKEWEEQNIKTFNTEYKLLTVRFHTGFLEISNQEYDNYNKIKSFVMKYASSKEKKK